MHIIYLAIPEDGGYNDKAFKGNYGKSRRNTMVKITKDMTIGEILSVDYDLASVLMGGGMYCETEYLSGEQGSVRALSSSAGFDFGGGVLKCEEQEFHRQIELHIGLQPPGGMLYAVQDVLDLVEGQSQGGFTD